MSTATLAGHEFHVDHEGFLTDPAEWDEDLGAALAARIGIEMTEAHSVVRFLRDDFAAEGQTATLRRVAARSGVGVKELFALFPQKPARKMAYVAGLPKPVGCV